MATPVAERRRLIDLARQAIEAGLSRREPVVPLAALPAVLQAQAASFVTLRLEGDLRGCMGSLEAHRPLALDVALNAQAAAFRDPRFPPLSRGEFGRVAIHLALLSAAEPVDCDGEEDLLAQLRPGVDGLILEEGARRGTFLPAVWETLPEPRAFLRELKRKACLPPDFWSASVRVRRYTTESFS